MEANDARQLSMFGKGGGRTISLPYAFSSSGTVFLRWEKLINDGLQEKEPGRAVPTATDLDNALIEFSKDLELFRAFLMGRYERAEMTERNGIIGLNQRLLLRFMDRLCLLRQENERSEDLVSFYTSLLLDVEATLIFMEDLFSSGFDSEEKLPDSIVSKRKAEIKSLLQKAIDEPLGNQEPVYSTSQLLYRCVDSWITSESRPLFREYYYFKELLQEWINTRKGASQEGRNVLYVFNFNHEEFFEYEYERLLGLIRQEQSTRHKIALLKREQKFLNQLPVKVNLFWQEGLPSIQEQVNTWINEEVKYLEGGYANLVTDVSGESTDKIQTSLSVAKLAVIIRLLVIDKIIINRSVAPMLRVVAKVFSTLQKDAISVGSLETKYHAPDKATVNLVRDMLFKWINILAKL